MLQTQPASPPLIVTQAVTAAMFWSRSGELAPVSGNLVELWSAGADGRRSHVAARDNCPACRVQRRWFATGSCCSDTSFDKCYAQIWDAANGQGKRSTLRHRDGVGFASFSPDVACGHSSEDFTASIWNPELGDAWWCGMGTSPQYYIQSGQQWIVTASRDQTARVLDSETGAPLSRGSGTWTNCLKQIVWDQSKISL